MVSSWSPYKTIWIHIRMQAGKFQAPTTLIRFQTKTELFCIRLSCALQHQKRSPKTEQFENALRSGAIWNRCFLKTLFSSVDGENYAIWKRWRHQNIHDWAPDHSTVSIQNGGQTLLCGFNFTGRYIEMRMSRFYLSMRTEGIEAFSKRMGRCSVDGRKRYENGLVWTGP